MNIEQKIDKLREMLDESYRRKEEQEWELAARWRDFGDDIKRQIVKFQIDDLNKKLFGTH